MATTTWDELRIACLQKMFSLDETALVRNSTTTPYINMMPAAANEAMLILATVGRQFKKCYSLEQGKVEPSENLGGWFAYDLKGLIDDFYTLNEIFRGSDGLYEKFKNFRLEGERYLLLPAEADGTFRIWYDAYPPKITKDTAGDFEIDLHPEAVRMIPLYMAGQLYKDDDLSLAQTYMNEWAVWLEEIKVSARRAKGRNGTNGGWSSVTGWT